MSDLWNLRERRYEYADPDHSLNPKPARILAIGGSDSSGGAGIEADTKTITVLGGFALTAITAITVQDTRKIWAIEPVAPSLVTLAIRVALDDIGVDAIKIGMLGDAALVREIAAALPADVPVVVDPVLVSTSGTALIPETAIAAFLECLLPRATLITPNLPEAAILTGLPVTTGEEIIRAADKLRAMGAEAAMIKGGHGSGLVLTDRLMTAGGLEEFPQPRIATRHTHGTGCALASAIATGLGQGLALADAVRRAKTFLRAALNNPPGYGKGHGPLGHYAGIGL